MRLPDWTGRPQIYAAGCFLAVLAAIASRGVCHRYAGVYQDARQAAVDGLAGGRVLSDPGWGNGNAQVGSGAVVPASSDRCGVHGTAPDGDWLVGDPGLQSILESDGRCNSCGHGTGGRRAGALAGWQQAGRPGPGDVLRGTGCTADGYGRRGDCAGNRRNCVLVGFRNGRSGMGSGWCWRAGCRLAMAREIRRIATGYVTPNDPTP